MKGPHNSIPFVDQGKQSISLEPGGQFELSGAPLETLHQTCAEVNSHLYQVKAVAEEMGIGFLGIGFQPKLVSNPSCQRCDILRNCMPKVCFLGLDMMLQTCIFQVNLDFSSEDVMIRKFRAAMALFANSPFTEGRPNGFLSMRSFANTYLYYSVFWLFSGWYRFVQYVDHALDVPMYFAYRNKKYIDCTGMTFSFFILQQFLAGKLPCLPGELPTYNDWENHMTTLFPEVRLKRYLEMRGADGGPWRRLCALPAFWVPVTGLKTPFRDGLLKHVAEDVLKLAKDGLECRGYKEAGFLNAVAEVARTGVTHAENLLEMYNGEWGQSVDPVFQELLY
ncbi:unnamed protein product [Eruca vesicaria subsp. sativa]|uniref:glutamate--cysteine ligase n=1 Tax=Eruca vesicaria subsp. sativa TaxID=29727 RepID=A0ABC8KJV8_ERUVS|nr:unnamed protein product [Eruca vesicaria subsp. sativa]